MSEEDIAHMAALNAAIAALLAATTEEAAQAARDDLAALLG